ncbi:MAG: dicarboxylate/amino acid:cation symporter [Chloracidobacterium sp.]|nr:dicarboxylate/amino acid:cation symporter [Chloracidobacterium sp.]MDW8217727.1 dicarboxylate/amino acid:cation symporter [Acidobacteriota bacterium]
MKKFPLHWQILVGMLAGLIVGFAADWLGAQQFVKYWIKPFGTIFMNLLKMIAVPLIIASLIKGVSDMKDLSQLSRMGGRSLALYLLTTAVAVAIGLLIVNFVKPGTGVAPATREKLLSAYADEAKGRISTAKSEQDKGPLQPLVDIVPDNVFAATTDNRRMLQVIFFALLIGVGLILIAEEKAKPIRDIFDGLNEVILRLVDLVMLTAPVGVMALLATLITESPSADILVSLLRYALCVVAGLAVLIFAFYPVLVWLVTGKSYRFFMRGVLPAQLVAFSTSSSAATLPVTMERVQEHLGVHEEVAGFVLPIGATMNMDGTALYQGVAAVFIAQVLGIALDLGDQLSILLTATLASIGAAAVPSAGLIVLVIVLGAAGIPQEGLALIFAIDRPLDMCRTVANVTSDACVAMLVAQNMGLLGEPHERRLDDFYPRR